ncbi:hypothetical protein BEL04_02915 [Mucilaginibacter sp. PPCGB 2223]|uniref:hypothetical protein n=1 Tax=Mucilaginibacter sp. PPCGB 2223 TaxID=1886027 RepID=UPI000825708B|nr:hypothetical protein [Mucilaginibacter sp. PPCGB 2223]OCX53273.1 hypothetical protein BEL04_02915 [Mucilaginibacter sp. PPCGB 2223]
MVKLLPCLSILFFFTCPVSSAQTNTDSAQLARTAFIKSQTVKADSLNDLALKLAQPGASFNDLGKAIDHIMAGLHIYSKFRDSVGLRETFDHLGLVYHLQKKFTQAKWFILQSNEISREKHDTLNIISSLLALASVKQDIKDFTLAKRDLDEALSLAKTQSKIDEQIEVQKALVKYYTQEGDAQKAAGAFNRIKYLNDSVARAIAGQKNATVLTQNTRTDSLHHFSTTLDEEDADRKSFVIIGITLITAALAGICVLLYRRSKCKT